MGGRRGELSRSASDIDDGAFRLRLRWETVNVGDDGVAGGSKPLDARRARRSRAKSSGLPFRSNDSGALGRVSAALGRARRFFRVPTVSPFRNFSSRTVQSIGALVRHLHGLLAIQPHCFGSLFPFGRCKSFVRRGLVISFAFLHQQSAKPFRKPENDMPCMT